jgi:hypothetical protein
MAPTVPRAWFAAAIRPWSVLALYRCFERGVYDAVKAAGPRRASGGWSAAKLFGRVRDRARRRLLAPRAFAERARIARRQSVALNSTPKVVAARSHVVGTLPAPCGSENARAIPFISQIDVLRDDVAHVVAVGTAGSIIDHTSEYVADSRRAQNHSRNKVRRRNRGRRIASISCRQILSITRI